MAAITVSTCMSSSVSAVSVYGDQPTHRSSEKEAVCMRNAVTLLLMHEAPCLLLVKTLPLKVNLLVLHKI